MIEVPDLTRADVVFGNIDYLPSYDKIPQRFKRHKDPYVTTIENWFFNGLSEAEIDALVEREGVDKWKALAALKAILASWDPPQEHKTSGAAYLMYQWFSEESFE